jgi:hypothetical protein
MLSATAKAGMGVAPAVGVGSLGRVAPRRAARAAHLGVAPPRRGVRATPWSRRPGSVRLAGTCCCAQLLACSCPESATWLDPSLTTRAFAPRGASLACVVARAWTRHVSNTVSLRGAAFVLVCVLAESGARIRAALRVCITRCVVSSRAAHLTHVRRCLRQPVPGASAERQRGWTATA